jgi:hypothetical protein
VAEAASVAPLVLVELLPGLHAKRDRPGSDEFSVALTVKALAAPCGPVITSC